jgi:hypothetical protein
MDALRTELHKAVKALGYKNYALEIATASYHRVIVFVNNERIGVYDMDRHTFVD